MVSPSFWVLPDATPLAAPSMPSSTMVGRHRFSLADEQLPIAAEIGKLPARRLS
jgi:hypothetical protein